MKFLKTLVKNPHVTEVLKVFKHSNSTQKMVAAAGESFLVSLYGYGEPNISSKITLRYILYRNLDYIYSSNLTAFSPFAERQHPLRVYSNNGRGLKNVLECGVD